MTDVRSGMRVPILGGSHDGETVFVLAETPDRPPQIYREPIPRPLVDFLHLSDYEVSSLDTIDYRLSRYFDGPSLTESWVYIHPDHRFYGSYGVVAEPAPWRADGPDRPVQWEPAAFTPPMQWYYGEPAGDAACPDTSQPYFLDLIGRIDELT